MVRSRTLLNHSTMAVSFCTHSGTLTFHVISRGVLLDIARLRNVDWLDHGQAFTRKVSMLAAIEMSRISKMLRLIFM